jgi:hypothetical protein
MKGLVHVVALENSRMGSPWVRWVCTCGRRSKFFAFRGYAESAGLAHAKATGGRYPLGWL